MKQIPSLDLLLNYDYFLIDLWGVVHDGTSLYPGVTEFLEALRRHEKQVIFLSNAPRRAFEAKSVLQKLGVKDGLYKAIITSGEACFAYVQRNISRLASRKFYYIGPKKDEGLLSELGYKVTHELEGADFCVICGFRDGAKTIEDVFADLDGLLTMPSMEVFCVNPDKIVVKQGSGTPILCAGLIAEEFIKMGGSVKYFGKPYSEVYEMCLQEFSNSRNSNSTELIKRRTIAIGDGMETDIKGANNSSVDSIFVSGGIHKKEIEERGLSELMYSANAAPSYVISGISDLVYANAQEKIY